MAWRVSGILAAAAIALPLLSTTAVADDGVGEAVAVTDLAEASGDAGRRGLGAGSEIYVGDLVVTDGTGLAQIRFTDSTKMVVGNNSSLVIDEMLFRGKSAENRFAVRALGGAFRFISGESGGEGFSIRTPSATIGVRGTTFDIIVTPASGDNPGKTMLLLHDGEAKMCSEKDEEDCEVVATPCALLQTDEEDQVEEVGKDEGRDELLAEHFPYAASDEELEEEFRAGGAPCLQGGLSNQALNGALPWKEIGVTTAVIVGAIILGGLGGDGSDPVSSTNDNSK